MDMRDALKIVEEVEHVASYYDDGEDHSRRVVGAAFTDLARNLANALDVPECSCRWYHDSHNAECPRSEIEATP